MGHTGGACSPGNAFVQVFIVILVVSSSGGDLGVGVTSERLAILEPLPNPSPAWGLGTQGYRSVNSADFVVNPTPNIGRCDPFQANVPEGLPATVTSCLTVCAQVSDLN